MPLTESKGQMYTWVTHTWNTVKGECPHGCTYCYMKRWGKQKPVRFDEKELKTDLGSGNFIFVGSSCDLWAKEIPNYWIEHTMLRCHDFDNTYLFQSKNPNRFISFGLNQNPAFPLKTRLCTTIETNRWYGKYMIDAPHPEIRSMAMNRIDGIQKYITIEPIIDFDLSDLISMIKYAGPIQVNIGADSGNNHLPEPSKEKVLALIDELKKFTVIDQKKNLSRILNK